MIPGTLTVKPLQGDLIKDTSIIAMSPYCVILCGKQKFVSPVHEKGGRSPKWNWQQIIQIEEEESIGVEIWDYNKVGNNNFLGEGTYKILQLVTGGYDQAWINILFQGKQSGKIKVDLTFVPDQQIQPMIIQQQQYMQMPQQNPFEEPTQIQYQQQQYPQQYQQQQYGQIQPQFNQPIQGQYQIPQNYQQQVLINQQNYGQITCPQQPQQFQYIQPNLYPVLIPTQQQFNQQNQPQQQQYQQQYQQQQPNQNQMQNGNQNLK